MISAHYGLSDVFDNLIISLCKFTALSSEVSRGKNRLLRVPKEVLSFSHKSILICRTAFPRHIHLLPLDYTSTWAIFVSYPLE